MKKLFKKILLLFLLPVLFHSCVNKDYDLGNIEGSGSLNPALTLPIGTLKTEILDFIKGAGIDSSILEIGTDTIYAKYGGNMSLRPVVDIPFVVGSDVITNLPPGFGSIDFALDSEEASMDIDIFTDLESSGCALYPANPTIYCKIRNYIGADINIDINKISSHRGNEEKSANFGANASYNVEVGKAPAQNKYTDGTMIFNKTNGKINELFAIAPDRISYDFGMELEVPEGDFFMMKDKYVDIDYEVKIPFTFSAGTRLSNENILDFDLSGDDFISNLDNLILWIDYENRLGTTVKLEIQFLDENKNEIQDITKIDQMDAATESGKDAKPKTGTLEFKLDKDEVNDAKATHYIMLKSTLEVEDGDVNIHPTDYINLKLSAYLKVNI
ncbi:MAG: hypothetical protein LBS55_08110 [Prevotellaceae bacterium]|jgi:hypothetical protein|nr:hypothetical protein [Prevotellaceae bacterium]